MHSYAIWVDGVTTTSNNRGLPRAERRDPLHPPTTPSSHTCDTNHPQVNQYAHGTHPDPHYTRTQSSLAHCIRPIQINLHTISQTTIIHFTTTVMQPNLFTQSPLQLKTHTGSQTFNTILIQSTHIIPCCISHSFPTISQCPSTQTNEMYWLFTQKRDTNFWIFHANPRDCYANTPI